MGEIRNDKEIQFYIKDREFAIKKADFKETPQEVFLFNFFTKNDQNKKVKSDNKSVSIYLLDQEKGTEGTITPQDIQLFLQDKKVQKKGITKNDVVSFLKKMFKFNPTAEETMHEKLSRFHDADGKTLLTDELKGLFSLEEKRVALTDEISDKEGKIKKGFEIFDLNNDGKLDDIEISYLGKSGMLYISNAQKLDDYMQALDNSGAQTPAGTITPADKQKVYDDHAKEIFEQQQKVLNKFNINDGNGKSVVTDEVKALFQGSDGTITFDKITDENGNVKQNLEIFDLNGNGKLDESEKNYFSSGGHATLSAENKLTISNLNKAIEKLDRLAYEGGYNPLNNKITARDKQTLYNMVSSSKYMLQNLGDFPDEIQDQFVIQLKKKYLIETKEASGVHTGDSIGVDASSISKPEVASVMAHELTHGILFDRTPRMDSLLQEVITFYTEYRFAKEAQKNDPTFLKTVNATPSSGLKRVIIHNEYNEYFDEMRAKHPEMSDKDIAIEAFIKFKFDEYNGQYGPKVTPDYIRNADYSQAEDFFKRK